MGFDTWITCKQDTQQFLEDLQKQLNVTAEEHGDLLRSAMEAQQAEEKGESSFQGPRLSYRASTSLPAALAPSSRPLPGGPGMGGPSMSKKRKSSTGFVAPPSPQVQRVMRVAPRPDAAAVARHGLHEYMGRKIWRHWANENPKWVEGIVTDYNPTHDLHTITYNLNSGKEEWENFSFAKGKNPKEWYWSESEPMDPAGLFPPGALNDIHIRQIAGGKRGRGRGRPSNSHRTNGLEAGHAPVHSTAVTRRRHFVPVRRHQKLDQLLQTLTLEDLQDLRDAMQARTTDVRAHLDRMRPLFEGSGLSECDSCKLQLEDMAFKESRVRDELCRLGDSDDDL